MGDTLTVKRDELRAPDPLGLYERTQIVDPEAGEITVLTPITVGRLRDTARPIRFFSSITVTMGMVPRNVSFEIPAATLEEALNGWEKAARAAGEQYVAQAESARIKAQLAGGTQGARMRPLNS